MGAPKGNKYNEKWTEKKTETFLKKCLKLAVEDDKIYLLAQICAKMNTYEEIFSYLLRKYSENKDFQAIKKKIDTILKGRVIEKGYSSGGAAMSIFLLKNNYGMKDQTQVIQTNQQESDESIQSRITDLLRKAGIEGTS